MLTLQAHTTTPQVKITWQDPILKELHATREKLASEYGNDIRAICEAARRGAMKLQTKQHSVSLSK